MLSKQFQNIQTVFSRNYLTIFLLTSFSLAFIIIVILEEKNERNLTTIFAYELYNMKSSGRNIVRKIQNKGNFNYVLLWFLTFSIKFIIGLQFNRHEKVN